MEKNLIALGLLLRELEIPASIGKLDDRVRIQKAVYLAQSVARADFGYQYGWYLRGPYSTELTKDYYALQDHTTTQELAEYGLRRGVIKQLQPVKALLKRPQEVTLSDAQWVELLASVQYLRDIGTTDDELSDRIHQQKPNLAPYLTKGLESLDKFSEARAPD